MKPAGGKQKTNKTAYFRRAPLSILSVYFSVLFEVFFFRPSSSSEWFCSFQHFVWFLSSHRALPSVGNLCHSLWQDDFTRNLKQVINRFKIPQGLSPTLLFRRWSELPSRPGGVRGDSDFSCFFLGCLPELGSVHFLSLIHI